MQLLKVACVKSLTSGMAPILKLSIDTATCDELFQLLLNVRVGKFIISSVEQLKLAKPAEFITISPLLFLRFEPKYHS
jgi:hypothetical protein